MLKGFYTKGTGNVNCTKCPLGELAPAHFRLARCMNRLVQHAAGVPGLHTRAVRSVCEHNRRHGSLRLVRIRFSKAQLILCRRHTRSPPGSVANTFGASNCTLCSKGPSTVLSSTNLFWCAGSYSSAPGSRQCTQAGFGQFVNTTGATAYYDCPPGTLVNSYGASSCSPCDKGDTAIVLPAIACSRFRKQAPTAPQ